MSVAVGGRYALVIGCDTPHIEPLAVARATAAVAECLGDPDIGGFSVEHVSPSTASELRKTIEAFFQSRRVEDVVVIVVATSAEIIGDRILLHGADFEPDASVATSVPARFLSRLSDISMCRAQILLLDLVIPPDGDSDDGAKRAGDALPTMTRTLAKGEGRYVQLSAQSGTAQPVSASQDVQPAIPFSLITSWTEGLRTGSAEVNRQGLISAADAFHFAAEHMTAAGMKPPYEAAVDRTTADVVVARTATGSHDFRTNTAAAPTDRILARTLDFFLWIVTAALTWSIVASWNVNPTSLADVKAALAIERPAPGTRAWNLEKLLIFASLTAYEAGFTYFRGATPGKIWRRIHIELSPNRQRRLIQALRRAAAIPTFCTIRIIEGAMGPRPVVSGFILVAIIAASTLIITSSSRSRTFWDVFADTNVMRSATYAANDPDWSMAVEQSTDAEEVH